VGRYDELNLVKSSLLTLAVRDLIRDSARKMQPRRKRAPLVAKFHLARAAAPAISRTSRVRIRIAGDRTRPDVSSYLPDSNRLAGNKEAIQGLPGLYLERNRAVELPKRTILPTILITRARARGLLYVLHQTSYTRTHSCLPLSRVADSRDWT